MSNDLYDAIKQISTMFYIKCNKYSKEELTFPLRETLFNEAFNEFCTMNSINNELTSEKA